MGATRSEYDFECHPDSRIGEGRRPRRGGPQSGESRGASRCGGCDYSPADPHRRGPTPHGRGNRLRGGAPHSFPCRVNARRPRRPCRLQEDRGHGRERGPDAPDRGEAHSWHSRYWILSGGARHRGTTGDRESPSGLHRGCPQGHEIVPCGRRHAEDRNLRHGYGVLRHAGEGSEGPRLFESGGKSGGRCVPRGAGQAHVAAQRGGQRDSGSP